MSHGRANLPTSQTGARAASRRRAALPQQPASRADHLLALQRTVGNQAVARFVAQSQAASLARAPSMPLQSTVAPGTPGTTEFADFLKLIRAEEAKMAPADLANTKQTITKLRKLFYGTAGWDKHLIPGAAATTPLYDVEETEAPGSRQAIPNSGGVDYVNKEARLKGAPASLTDPSKIQEVRMPNGDFVDVGHVLAGLDAINFPSVASGPVGAFPISTNVGAVTWIGDLGSIAAETILKAVRAGKSTYTPADLQKQIDGMAPSQDMLGNIDAYVIGDAFSGEIGKTAGGMRVSDLLEQYYGGKGVASATGEKARDQRFTIFANKVGLGALSGSAFAGEAAWIKTATNDVENAAALYTGTVTDNNAVNLFGYSGRAGLVGGMSANPLSGKLVVTFVEALKAKVRAEAAAAAVPAP